MRGGAKWSSKPTSCSSTCRNAYAGDYRIEGVGFRVVLASLVAAQTEPAKPPGDAKTQLTWAQGAARNSLGMVMMPIPAGDFIMGSPQTKLELPQHKVKITKPFFMSATKVTQAQWKAVMGINPSYLPGDDLPVENVTWNDCQEFLKKLSDKEGKVYRLPTEAEWEYACRAGSTTKYFFGEDAAILGDYGWFGANSDRQTHPVGLKKANAWGLYDMYGNVWEWCQDWLTVPYGPEEQTDPMGAKGFQRALRGGGWYCEADRCRSAYRGGLSPNSRYYIGLRVVMVAAPP
jgi:formylglycine-generating enzyme required for sulfatase activity